MHLQGTEETIGLEKDYLVFIAPRYACCDRLQDLRRISKTMHIYESGHDEPVLEMDLYEAKAELQQDPNGSSVRLVPTHRPADSNDISLTPMPCLSVADTSNRFSFDVELGRD